MTKTNTKPKHPSDSSAVNSLIDKLLGLHETRYRLLQSFGVLTYSDVANEVANLEKDIMEINRRGILIDKEMSQKPDSRTNAFTNALTKQNNVSHSTNTASESKSDSHGHVAHSDSKISTNKVSADSNSSHTTSALVAAVNNATNNNRRYSFENRKSIESSFSPEELVAISTKSIDNIECSVIEADFGDVVDCEPSAISSLLPPKVCWSFPREKSSLYVQGIQGFCFPNGVNVDFVLKSSAMSYINSALDERHVLQFMNIEGTATHACCLVVNIAFPSPSMDMTRAMYYINRRKRSAKRIKTEVCKYLLKCRRLKWRVDADPHRGQTLQHTQSMSSLSATSQRIKSSIFSRAFGNRDAMTNASTHSNGNLDGSSHGLSAPASMHSMAAGNHATASAGHGSTTASPSRHPGFFSKLFGQRKSIVGSSSDNTTNETLHSVSELTDASEGSSTAAVVIPEDIHPSMLGVPQDQPALERVKSTLSSDDDSGNDTSESNSPEKTPNTTDSNAYRKDFESRQSQNELMLAAREELLQRMHEKWCIVTKRAYCIITKEPIHSKIFKILETLADAERKLSLETIMAMKESDPQHSDIIKNYRNTYFEHVSDSLGEISSKKRNISGATKPISVEGFVEKLDISNDREFPTLREWTTAVLLTYLSPAVVLKVIHILLSEKSLIIYGKHNGIVTAITSAVVSLMSPFHWEGVFVPLIPQDAREIFEAPVPFVVGTVSSPHSLSLQKSENIALLCLDEGELKPKTYSKRERRSHLGLQSQHSAAASNDSSNVDTQTNHSNESSANEVVATRQQQHETIDEDDFDYEQFATDLETVYSSWFSRLPDMSTDMATDEKLENRIAMIRKLLMRKLAAANHRSEQSFSKTTFSGRLTSPDVLFISNMTEQDKTMVRQFLEVVRQSNQRYCGDLDQHNNWKKYSKRIKIAGELNGSMDDPINRLAMMGAEGIRESFHGNTGNGGHTSNSSHHHNNSHNNNSNSNNNEDLDMPSAYQFLPDEFLEPLRCFVEFQTIVSKTQYFNSYFESVRLGHMKKENQSRLMIRDWLSYRLIRKKSSTSMEVQQQQEHS